MSAFSTKPDDGTLLYKPLAKDHLRQSSARVHAFHYLPSQGKPEERKQPAEQDCHLQCKVWVRNTRAGAE